IESTAHVDEIDRPVVTFSIKLSAIMTYDEAAREIAVPAAVPRVSMTLLLIVTVVPACKFMPPAPVLHSSRQPTIVSGEMTLLTYTHHAELLNGVPNCVLMMVNWL